MSLHVKKINRQFSVLKKPELSGFFHAPAEEHHCERCGISETREVIARLCRAFFMHMDTDEAFPWAEG